MNRIFRKVLEMLKTNKDIKALGFSRKELKGIAARVADKLGLEENATDEDVDDAVNEAIDDILPYLKLTQSAVDRQVQEFKNSHPKEDEELDDDDEPSRRKPSGIPNGDGGNDDNKSALAELKELFQMSFSKLSERMDAYEKIKEKDNRRSVVEKMLKDTGKFGERKLRAFSRMSFENGEAFDEYLDELQEEIDEENQERANKGLETLGNPPAGNFHKKDDELMSDDEIKALAQD